MRLLALAIILLPAALLAQDASDETPTDPDMELGDSCGVAGFAGLIGQTGEIARLIELDQPMRVIDPDSAVTMDFRPDRINFILDEDDVILRVECG